MTVPNQRHDVCRAALFSSVKMGVITIQHQLRMMILVLSSSHTEAARGLGSNLARVIVRGVGGSEAAEENEEAEGAASEDDDLAKDRLVGAELSPLAVALTDVAPELLETELVVNHSTKSDGITEELQR